MRMHRCIPLVAILGTVVCGASPSSAGEPQKVSIPGQGVTWTAAPANAVHTGVRSARKVIYDKKTGKIKLE